MTGVEQLPPLPEAEDPFVVDRCEARLVKKLEAAGYAPPQARVQVRMVLRQLAVAWGLTLPPGAPWDGRTPAGGMQADAAVELRRSDLAKPLWGYEDGEAIRWRDEDGRWVAAVVVSYDCMVGGVGGLHISRGDRQEVVTDPARVQEAG